VILLVLIRWVDQCGLCTVDKTYRLLCSVLSPVYLGRISCVQAGLSPVVLRSVLGLTHLVSLFCKCRTFAAILDRASKFSTHKC
jgi:hypothetical protein